MSVWFGIVGRNKRCITLDLRTDKGQNTFKALADTADIIVENFRPGTLEKWGLGYDVLSRSNPGLILVRVSGYGQSGPKKNEAGYASVGEAFGGLRYVMGEPDRPPSPSRYFVRRHAGRHEWRDRCAGRARASSQHR